MRNGKKVFQIIVLLTLVWPTFAEISTILASKESGDIQNHLAILVSFGFINYQHAYNADNPAALGRLALSTDLISTRKSIFGLELGIQSGSNLRFEVPGGTALNPLPANVSMRPMIDLLFTTNTATWNESLWFTQLKGGIAYRQWQFQKDLVFNKSEFSGELQAGLGYPLNELASLNVVYQGIFGRNPRIQGTGFNSRYITSLPIQHGVLFGLSVIT